MRFSRHAKLRQAERGINDDEVAAVVAGPEVVFTDKKGNPCYIRTINERRIKVVISATDAAFVITVIDLDA